MYGTLKRVFTQEKQIKQKLKEGLFYNISVIPLQLNSK